MQKATVKCDAVGCGWERVIDFDEVPAWHRQFCPNCGLLEIVTDEDLQWWHGAKALIHFSSFIDPEKKAPTVDILFDTARLKGSAP